MRILWAVQFLVCVVVARLIISTVFSVSNQTFSTPSPTPRLGLEIRITDLNLTLCDVQMQLRATSVEEQGQELTHSGGVSATVLSHRAALAERAASLEHEMESIVQQGFQMKGRIGKSIMRISPKLVDFGSSRTIPHRLSGSFVVSNHSDHLPLRFIIDAHPDVVLSKTRAELEGMWLCGLLVWRAYALGLYVLLDV